MSDSNLWPFVTHLASEFALSRRQHCCYMNKEVNALRRSEDGRLGNVEHPAHVFLAERVAERTNEIARGRVFYAPALEPHVQYQAVEDFGIRSSPGSGSKEFQPVYLLPPENPHHSFAVVRV